MHDKDSLKKQVRHQRRTHSSENTFPSCCQAPQKALHSWCKFSSCRLSRDDIQALEQSHTAVLCKAPQHAARTKEGAVLARWDSFFK